MALDIFKGTMAAATTAIASIGVNTKVTIEDADYTAASLQAINDKTDLPILLLKTAALVPLNDSATNIIAALDGITNYTGAIKVTDVGDTTALNLNAIAKLTTGKVTATLAAATPIDLDTVALLNNVIKPTDSITFKPATATSVSGTSELTALINLKKLLPSADFSGVDTLEGTSADVAAIKSALNIAKDAVVKITAGQISAVDANAIAKATAGALTAEIKDGSVAETLKALANVDADDIITFKTTDTTADASDLVALDAKVNTFTAPSITTITENAATIGVAAKTVKEALIIANDAAVKITGTISATNAGLIATATAGVVTANITPDSAAALKAALTGADLNDALTLTILKGTASAADLNDLNGLTSVAVNASAITEVTATTVLSVTDLYAANAAKTVSGLGNEAIKITTPISATEANTIAILTTGVVTASVSAAAANVLVAALTDAKATDALTLEVTGIAAAADLKALDAKTSVIVNASAVTEITGTVADVKKVLTSSGIIVDKTDVAITIDPTTKISAADANTITGATFGKVTAEVTAGTAAALNKALTNAAGTDDLILTILKGTAAASDLIALDTKTNLNVDATAVTTITGIASDVYTVLTAAGIDTAANVAVTLSGTVTAAQANAIAIVTTGKVTATIAAADAATLNGALTDTIFPTDGNAYTLTVNNIAGAAAATVLNSLDAKTSVKVKVDAVEVTGDYAALETLYVTNKAGFANLGNEKVSISNGASASQINTIAKATTGAVTASISNTADVLVASLKDTNAADKLTLTVTGEAKASDLNILDGKTSEDVIIGGTTTVIGNIADVTKVFVTNKDNFTNENTTAVTISGTVTAAQADAIADVTDKAVTATIAAGTATALNTALVDGTTTPTVNAYKLTVNGATADVADLNALVAKTTEAIKIDAKEITGAASLLKTLFAGDAAKFTGEETKAVKITDTTVAVADVNTIAKATTGVVTATVTETDATAVNNALADLGTDGLDKLTLVLSGTAAAADLKALDAKTSVVVDAKGVTEITGSAADVKTVLAAKTISKAANVAVDTGVPSISAADANTISKATTGEVKATVTADTAAALKSALAGVSNDGVDALTLTVNGTTAAAADLIALDAKTSVDVVVSATTVTGNITDLTSVYVSANGLTIGHEAVTISGSVSATQADAIAKVTDKAVTATITAGTAAALNGDLTDATTNAYKLTVNNDNTTTLATDLTGLDGKTTVAVDAHLVTDISGTSAQVLAAYVANTAGTITGLGNETVHIIGSDATVANVSAINTATTGLVTVAEVDTAAGAFSLTDLGLLAGITGLTTVDATKALLDTQMTITAADLFAVNDSLGNITLTINADAAKDTLNLAGWAKGATASGYDSYSISGNFDGVAGSEIYTVKVTTGVVVTA